MHVCDLVMVFTATCAKSGGGGAFFVRLTRLSDSCVQQEHTFIRYSVGTQKISTRTVYMYIHCNYWQAHILV